MNRYQLKSELLNVLPKSNWYKTGLKLSETPGAPNWPFHFNRIGVQYDYYRGDPLALLAQREAQLRAAAEKRRAYAGRRIGASVHERRSNRWLSPASEPLPHQALGRTTATRGDGLALLCGRDTTGRRYRGGDTGSAD